MFSGGIIVKIPAGVFISPLSIQGLTLNECGKMCSYITWLLLIATTRTITNEHELDMHQCANLCQVLLFFLFTWLLFRSWLSPSHCGWCPVLWQQHVFSD